MDRSARSLLTVSSLVIAVFLAMNNAVRSAPPVDWWPVAALLLLAALLWLWERLSTRVEVSSDDAAFYSYTPSSEVHIPPAEGRTPPLMQSMPALAVVPGAHPPPAAEVKAAPAEAKPAPTPPPASVEAKAAVAPPAAKPAPAVEVKAAPAEAKAAATPVPAPPPAPVPTPPTPAVPTEVKAALVKAKPAAIISTSEAKAAAVSPAPAAAKPAVSGKPDDLKIIEGIGPKMAAALAAGGIDTFAKLAQCSEADIRAAVEAAGMRFAPSLPTWAEQAGYAAKGDMAGLEAFQGTLKSGRKAKK